MNITEDYQVLSKHFNNLIVGQSNIVDGLLLNLKLREIFNSTKKLQGYSLPLNILLRGKSGSGKTHIVTQICKDIGIPYVARNITDYTSSGYEGGSLKDILRDLVASAKDLIEQKDLSNSTNTPPKASRKPTSDDALDEMLSSLGITRNRGGDVSKQKLKREAIKLAELKGVVFLDETDKLFFKTNSYNVGTQGVIRELLGYLSGSDIDTDSGIINTSGILFICAGAFDMVSFKDVPTEIMGRLGTRLKTNSPTPENIVTMLTRESIGMLAPVSEIIKAKKGKGYKLSPDVASYVGETIVAHESAKSIGLRRLTSFVTELLKYCFMLKINPGDTVEITKDVVDECLNFINAGITGDDEN